MGRQAATQYDTGLPTSLQNSVKTPMRFGETSALSSVVYALVGLSGLYRALTWKSIQRRWQSDGVLARA